MDASGHTKKAQDVSELAVQAKTDPSVILQLWEMVERLIRVICWRYCRPEAGNRLFDHEDLCQSAYFAFLKAVETYDPARGSFVTILIYHIRRSCSKEAGRYGSKRDAIFDAGSINEPLSKDEEGSMLMDTLEDPHAREPFDIIERDMLVDMILAEADHLPHPNQGWALRGHTYLGRSLDELASVMGISRQGVALAEERAIFHLRRRPALRELYDEYKNRLRESIRESAMSPYRKRPVRSFQTDFTSVVEGIVMRMECDDT